MSIREQSQWCAGGIISRGCLVNCRILSIVPDSELVKISVAEPGIYTNIDMLLVVLIFLGTISFSMFGGYMGGKKFQAQKHSTEENKKIEKHQMQPGPIKEKSLIIE